MPVSNEAVKAYTDLGIAGAALLLILIFIILLFAFAKYSNSQTAKMIQKFNTVESSNQTAAIEKLVTKIDQLITSNYEYTSKLNEVILSNDKDQELTFKLLSQIVSGIEDIQKRMIRIDDRTFGCLRTHGRIEEDKKEK